MRQRGLWISPSEFKNFAAVDKVGSLSQEIAVRQRSIDFYSIGMYLPNPDPVLKKMGKDITVYKELRADAVVRGCIASRKAGTKKLLWEVDRGKTKSRQAKFVTDAIKALPVSRIIGQVLNAPLFGNQPFEILWDQATWTPTDVVAKPQQWFVYDENNKPRFLTKSDMFLGEELPEKKFIFATNDATYENPYGDPVLSSCFWPVTFRKGGYKFWITFTEKFGMPFIVGKVPRGVDQTERDKLADMLELMVQDAIAVIPDDASVEIPEQKSTASADLYDKLIRACTGEINVAVLGHSAAAESTPGKLGNENQAGDVRADIVADDKRIVEDTFNTLIDWICKYNFAERTERPRFIMYEEEDVDLDQATRDKTLSDAGVTLSADYYQRAYGFEDGDIVSVNTPQRTDRPFGPDRSQTSDGTAQFSKGQNRTMPDQQKIDNAVANMDPKELQAQAEGILKPIIDLINSGSSYEDVMKNLVETFPDMDPAALEEMLSRAIFVSECLGRLTAENK